MPIEVIVVDDGSTDRSAEIAKRFVAPVRYDCGCHEGAGAARNRGVNLAVGNFFSFLDADDLWMEDKLAQQMAALDDDPELDMVFGHIEQFHSPDLDEDMKAKIAHAGETSSSPHAGTLLIKRASFFRVGPFATNWRVGEFIDWYAKAVDQGLKSFTLPELVMKRRLHADNMGTRERESRSDYVRILKASLDRRRKKDVNR